MANTADKPTYIDSVTPSSVPVGWEGTARICGRGFDKGSWAVFDDHFYETRFVDAKTLDVEVPSNVTGTTGDHELKVHTFAGGNVSNDVTFTVSAADVRPPRHEVGLFTARQAALTGFPFEADLGANRSGPVKPDDGETVVVERNVSFAHRDLATAVDPLLTGAFNAYYQGCTCGQVYDNNCAHYLSNAFMRQHWPVTFPSAAAKCPHGRLIRAKEMLDWFRSAYAPQFAQNHNGITYGYWLVYQEEADGQGHVCIHRHQGGFDWRGTGDYPAWPVQWHYYY